jgi:hypothetical protein
MLRKTPWAEESMTQLFCDLFDEEAQSDEALNYPIAKVRDDLALGDEPLSLDWEISTRQYSRHEERNISQSDIGLVIEYRDQFEAADSFTVHWLLQAKRLFKVEHKYSGSRFELDSAFSSYSSSQHARIKLLQSALGSDCIRYLLYCPRPKSLDETIRERLTHARTKALAGRIFDYSLGLQLRDDLLAGSPTIASGVFVSDIDPFPNTLLTVHQNVFNTTFPFSWFIAEHFDGNGKFARFRVRGESERPKCKSLLERVVEGDASVVKALGIEWNEGRVIPRHTVKIAVTSGSDRNRKKHG